MIPTYDDSEPDPREFYPLVDQVMAEDDEQDPSLASYQDAGGRGDRSEGVVE